jgi:hypothetical protein
VDAVLDGDLNRFIQAFLLHQHQRELSET